MCQRLTTSCTKVHAYACASSLIAKVQETVTFQVRLEKELHINQLELHSLKLTASAERLSELSPSAELALQTQLAELESRLSGRQQEMADVSSQLPDHREVLASLQQVFLLCFQALCRHAVLCHAALRCAVHDVPCQAQMHCAVLSALAQQCCAVLCWLCCAMIAELCFAVPPQNM